MDKKTASFDVAQEFVPKSYSVARSFERRRVDLYEATEFEEVVLADVDE